MKRLPCSSCLGTHSMNYSCLPIRREFTPQYTILFGTIADILSFFSLIELKSMEIMHMGFGSVWLQGLLSFSLPPAVVAAYVAALMRLTAQVTCNAANGLSGWIQRLMEACQAVMENSIAGVSFHILALSSNPKFTRQMDMCLLPTQSISTILLTSKE